MMIPGGWEPRPRLPPKPGTPADPVNAVAPLPQAPRQSAESRDGNGPGPETQRPELPIWLKTSIFTATLLAAMWLAMAVWLKG